MKIQKPFWNTFALFLHAWIVLAACWPVLAAVIGFQPADCAKFLIVSLILFLPVITSYYLIRKTRRLWQYVLGAILIQAVTAGLAIKFVQLLRICPPESLEFPSVSRMFEDGVPQIVGQVASVGMILLLGTICLGIRGSVRIKKMKLKKIYEEMEGGSAPILSKEDWEFPTILDAPHVFQWIYYGVCYLICTLLNVESCYRFLFWLILLDAVLLLICTYEDRLFYYIRDHQKIANLPAETMQKISRIVLRMALLVMLACVMPAVLYGQEPLAGILDELPEPEPVDPDFLFPEEHENPVMDQSQDEMMEYLKNIKPTELPKWLKKVMEIAADLLVVAAFVLLIRGIIQGIRQMGSSFAGETEDEIVFLDKSIRDEAKIIKKLRGELDGRGTPNAKIRRLYKKLVRKAAKRKPGAAETPAEIEENSGLTRIEGSRMLHELYERARYSREGCSGEEADEMRRIYTNLH